jgi:hypothetical protein
MQLHIGESMFTIVVDGFRACAARAAHPGMTTSGFTSPRADSIFKQPNNSRYDSAIPRRDAPELCLHHAPRKRAYGTPGARCTRSLACEIKQTHEQIHHRYTVHPGVPHAMVLTAYSALSPVTGLV